MIHPNTLVSLRATVESLIDQIRELSVRTQTLEGKVYELESELFQLRCAVDPESCPDDDDDDDDDDHVDG